MGMNAVLELPDSPSAGLEAPRARWKWTRKQYYKLAEQGYFAGRRVELIEGEIVYMPAVNYPHTASIQYALNKLSAVFGGGCWVRIQAPLQCGKSEPEPDLCVVKGGPPDYTDHPKQALLIVEVSDSTFSFDTKVKSVVYAKSGNPEYWVVDLKRRRLIVYTKPTKKGYKNHTILKATDLVRTLAAPKVPVRVADLLP
jgi:Uma2 family endonuclease